MTFHIKKFYDIYYEESKQPTFLEELERLINKHSVENGSDTPDFLLAEYLGDCLIAYQKVVTKRDKWFGVDMWSENKLAKNADTPDDLQAKEGIELPQL